MILIVLISRSLRLVGAHIYYISSDAFSRVMPFETEAFGPVTALPHLPYVHQHGRLRFKKEPHLSLADEKLAGTMAVLV